MGRIVAIDYGAKRIGLAVTDPLKIIATPLETILTKEIFPFLQRYHEKETIELFVLGLPKNMNNEATQATPLVLSFEKKLKEIFPTIPLQTVDERFTSKMALATMITGGTTKKYRQQKGNVDKISAAIILQSYLESKHS